MFSRSHRFHSRTEAHSQDQPRKHRDVPRSLLSDLSFLNPLSPKARSTAPSPWGVSDIDYQPNTPASTGYDTPTYPEKSKWRRSSVLPALMFPRWWNFSINLTLVTHISLCLLFSCNFTFSPCQQFCIHFVAPVSYLSSELTITSFAIQAFLLLQELYPLHLISLLLL